MVSDALFSSNSTEWATPQDLFDELNQEFAFSLDVCATEDNHKCDKYLTIKEDGLIQDWGNERVFCNPPYGREISSWVKKCAEHNGLAVILLPARTDTKWFHEYIYQKQNAEIRFIKGRLKFGGAQNSAPFPSMIVVFRNFYRRNKNVVHT
jgi:site-specific DNA-methyltransferase (adenine-specific)